MFEFRRVEDEDYGPIRYAEMMQWMTDNSPLFFPSIASEMNVAPEMQDVVAAYVSNTAKIYTLATLPLAIVNATQHEGDGAEYLENLANTEENGVIQIGLAVAMESMITATWRTFEVLATDTWEYSLNCHPRELADLRGNGSRINRLAGGVKNRTTEWESDGPSKGIPIGEIHRVTRGTFNLDGKWGTLLKQSFKFTTLGGIREAYSKAFHCDSRKIDSCLASRDIDALALVRNLLIHKAGIADTDYCRRQPKEAPTAPALKEAEHLTIDGKLVENLLSPALRCCTDLLVAVNDWLATAK
jgi:hypothetical protein